MAIILPFQDFHIHISKNPRSKKALLDTCVLISFSHDTNEFHDETLDLFKTMNKEQFQTYCNVNIRSEFLDFQRRLIITEALTSLGQQIKGILSYRELAMKLKTHRTMVQKRAMLDRPLVLNDSSIKQFKKLLSFKYGITKNVWPHFCSTNLRSRLKLTFDLVEKGLKLKYISLRKGNSPQEISKDVSWDNMYRICITSGLSISDSMILNLFESSNIPFLITTDFDLVYSSAISRDNKLVFCPNRIYEEFRDNYLHLFV